MKKLLKVIKIIILVLLCIAILAGAVFGLQYIWRSAPDSIRQYETTNPIIDGKVSVVAHRSGAGIVPEETMAAFRYCAENPDFNIDYYEFDLHLTKDNVLVLLHDSKLDRVSDSAEVFGEEGVKAADKTYEELRRLNFGAKFVAEDGSAPYAGLTGDAVPDDVRIASLDTVLDYLESKNAKGYIIEIKDSGELGTRAADLLTETLSARGLVEKSIIGSFNDETMDYLKSICPETNRSAATGDVIDLLLHALINDQNYSPDFNVAILPFGKNSFRESYYINLGAAWFMNYCHSRNIALHYWTINDEADMSYLNSLGADAIITDYPDRLYKIQHP